MIGFEMALWLLLLNLDLIENSKTTERQTTWIKK
jgi:hypothetical protein